MCRNIKENAYTFPQNTGVSTAACSLISLMLTTDPGDIHRFLPIDKRPKVKELIQHSFFNQVIIKDPSYDDLASSRMFILQSIETQLQNTLATETSPRPMRTFKEGSKENIPAHTNIHMLEHTTPSPKATFNPIGAEKGHPGNTEKGLVLGGVLPVVERRLGLIESIYHNICRVISTAESLEALEHTAPCKLFNHNDDYQ